MKKYIIITADTNDADYITSKNEITDEILLELQLVIKCLQDRYKLYQETGEWKYNHNWEVGDFNNGYTPEELYIETGLLTQDQVNLMNEFIPNDEYGIHTIESIEILTVIEELKLL